MTEHNQGFEPRMQKEDVIERFSQLSPEDAQLVYELREHYSLTRARSARGLARAWERIQQEQRRSDAPILQTMRANTTVPPPRKIERISHVQEIQSSSQKASRWQRIRNGLAAAALLVVLLGSLALVYSHLHAQTGTGARGVQVTANPAQTIANGATSLSWPVGQSTYWANLRYHQLTDYWVSWNGNADQWVSGARAAGWNVSQTPHVPSIIVLMSFVQGASEYGHVGVVEKLLPNSNPLAVDTTNMDWQTNGGGWDIVSHATFTVGPGVYFIWHS